MQDSAMMFPIENVMRKDFRHRLQCAAEVAKSKGARSDTGRFSAAEGCGTRRLLVWLYMR